MLVVALFGMVDTFSDLHPLGFHFSLGRLPLFQPNIRLVFLSRWIGYLFFRPTSAWFLFLVGSVTSFSDRHPLGFPFSLVRLPLFHTNIRLVSHSRWVGYLFFNPTSAWFPFLIGAVISFSTQHPLGFPLSLGRSPLFHTNILLVSLSHWVDYFFFTPTSSWFLILLVRLPLFQTILIGHKNTRWDPKERQQASKTPFKETL